MNSIKRICKRLALSRWDNPPRLLIDQFVNRIAQQIGVGAWILDAGAGECVYAPAFAQCHYISCDRAIGDVSWDYSRLSVIGDIGALPFRQASFDVVLCTQTLEHVTDPHVVLREMAALLKPGGKLYLTVPFLGDPLHQEPYDFYRYTKYSLSHLLDKAGLSPVSISPIGGIWFLFCCYFWFFVVYEVSSEFAGKRGTFLPRVTRLVFRTTLLLFARLCTMLVIVFRGIDVGSDKFTYGYTVMAQKPIHDST